MQVQRFLQVYVEEGEYIYATTAEKQYGTNQVSLADSTGPNEYMVSTERRPNPTPPWKHNMRRTFQETRKLIEDKRASVHLQNGAPLT